MAYLRPAAMFFVLFTVSHNAYTLNLKEIYTVMARYVAQPAQVGEIAPISSYVGNELIRHARQHQDEAGIRLLEAGGGCGAVSVCIAQALRPQDHLDVVEIDPQMCEFLKKRLAGYSNVSVHCCSILDWKPEEKYQVIVSTLPYNSLGVDFAQSFIEYVQGVADQGCRFSYVEYPIVRQVLQYFYSKKNQHDFLKVQSVMEQFRSKYLIEQRLVYFNVPPVAVYHLQLVA